MPSLPQIVQELRNQSDPEQFHHFIPKMIDDLHSPRTVWVTVLERQIVLVRPASVPCVWVGQGLQGLRRRATLPPRLWDRRKLFRAARPGPTPGPPASPARSEG